MPALVLALSALLASATAASDPSPDQVRYQRQSTTAPRDREDALERRLERAKRVQAREAEQVFGDPGHQFRVCRACVEPEMRLRQIEFLINLIETTSEDDVEYPTYLFRLADHYLEEKAHHEVQAASLQEKIDELELSSRPGHRADLEIEMAAFESEPPPKPGD